MRFKKGTPGDGGEARAEQFGYTKTQPGLKGGWAAWCAHDPYWCQAHEHNDRERGTKVCLHWMTDGALRCPRCRPANPPTWIAYVPVWREIDLAPCMVICHRAVEDLLRPLKFGTYVMVGRVEGKTSVYVREQEQQRKWTSTHPLRQGPCDIAVSLLTMWGYPELNNWLALSDRRAKEEANKARGAPPAKKQPDPMTAAAHRLVDDAIANASGINDALEVIKFRAGGHKPSTNGKHET